MMNGNGSNPYSQLVQQQQLGSQIQARPMQFQYQPEEQQHQMPQKQSGGPMAMMGKMGGGSGGGSSGGGGGMMGMSDERSKKEIQRLESANQALTRALSTKVDYPNTQAPSSGAQALGQQENLGPMQARFTDTPAANRVAAQNVGLNGGTQPVAQQQPSAGFQVNSRPPDLSALDEAYRRLGATQGT
jgi:hypothetical protein